MRFATSLFSAIFVLGLVACTHPAPLPPKALELNREGAAAIASGDLQTAEARIALAIEYNPRFTEAWVNLGLVEMMHGNFEAARRDLLRARRLNPDLPAPHHALGLLAERKLAPAEAETYYRAALKVDPGFAPSRINLGRLLFARGAFEDAREQFLRVTQVAAEWADGWAGLVETLLRLERTEEADRVLADAHRRLGAHPSLELLEARFLLRRSAYHAAAERLVPLSRLPDRTRAVAALSWLAIARLGEGELDAAALAAERAVRLDPDDAVARYAIEAVRATRPDR
jgi:tetratricopeptide (TPR) repeat protein